MTTTSDRPMTLAALALLAACGTEARTLPFELQAHSFANSGWSEPVNLGPVVNSSAGDQNATLSSDGLSLYFVSNRPGGLGGTDIWVSRRACDGCPWEAPDNLGPPVNTSDADGSPSLSTDGHLLFFFNSDRPGGFGGPDIYMSRRTNTNDDFGWGSPVNLGADVNTAGFEGGTRYAQNPEQGDANLYFNRASAPAFLADLYIVRVTRDGATFGPAVPVSELNDPTASDNAPSVRADGREIYFGSTRSGSLGLTDLWVATRRSVHEPWSPPENLGAPLNTAVVDQQPGLSPDGRTLFFTSTRPGGSGGNDIWMSTRTPSGQ